MKKIKILDTHQSEIRKFQFQIREIVKLLNQTNATMAVYRAEAELIRAKQEKFIRDNYDIEGHKVTELNAAKMEIVCDPETSIFDKGMDSLKKIFGGDDE